MPTPKVRTLPELRQFARDGAEVVHDAVGDRLTILNASGVQTLYRRVWRDFLRVAGRRVTRVPGEGSVFRIAPEAVAE